MSFSRMMMDNRNSKMCRHPFTRPDLGTKLADELIKRRVGELFNRALGKDRRSLRFHISAGALTGIPSTQSQFQRLLTHRSRS
jgi:hypothetical protein